jgi:hypothetical protein
MASFFRNACDVGRDDGWDESMPDIRRRGSVLSTRPYIEASAVASGMFHVNSYDSQFNGHSMVPISQPGTETPQSHQPGRQTSQ